MKFKFEFKPKKDFITSKSDEVTTDMVLRIELMYNNPFIYAPARREIAKAYREEHDIKDIEPFLKEMFFSYKKV